MPRNSKKSHVFAKKSKPKHSSASKKQRLCSPPNIAPIVVRTSYTIESNKETNDNMSTNSSPGSSASSEVHPEPPTMAKNPSIPVQTSKTSTNPNFTSVSVTQGSSIGSICSPLPRRTTNHDVADHPDKQTLSTYLEQSVGNELDKLRPPNLHSLCHGMTSVKSLGPNLMFSSLFGVGHEMIPATVPFVQWQASHARPVHWDQPEQVPAYATSSHAAWFSNPVNKIVRGVTMGVSRTVAELQRTGRAATPVVDVSSVEGLLDSSSTATCDKLDEKVINSKIAERPHPEQASKRIHVPLLGGLAVSDDISTDPLLHGVFFQRHEDNIDSQYYREPIPDIDPTFSDDEDEGVDTPEAMNLSSVPSTPLAYRSESPSSATSISVETKNSRSVLLPDHEFGVRSTPASSRTSLSLTDFHIEKRQIEAPK